MANSAEGLPPSGSADEREGRQIPVARGLLGVRCDFHLYELYHGFQSVVHTSAVTVVTSWNRSELNRISRPGGRCAAVEHYVPVVRRESNSLPPAFPKMFPPLGYSPAALPLSYTPAGSARVAEYQRPTPASRFGQITGLPKIITPTSHTLPASGNSRCTAWCRLTRRSEVRATLPPRPREQCPHPSPRCAVVSVRSCTDRVPAGCWRDDLRIEDATQNPRPCPYSLPYSPPSWPLRVTLSPLSRHASVSLCFKVIHPPPS